jgi:putative hydrolase of the HAD superfamily
MNILLDLDETLLREAEARNQAAINFHRQFASLQVFSESDFLIHWHDLQARHFSRFTRGEISFEEHRRERLRELFQPYESDLTPTELEARFDFYLTRYEKNWTLFDDVRPFLARTSHCKLGIVTNGDSKQQRDKLRLTGIYDHFQAIIISSEVGAAKPDPQIFVEACRALSVSPSDCLFVGDRLDLDVEGSRAAGLRSLWLNRAGLSIDRPDIESIQSLAEIKIEHSP